ncbi:hypothetical protein D3C71_1332310 [compost metagenome]
MDHVVELGHHQVFVADQRIVDRCALGLGDVTDPAVVVTDRVDAEAQDLGVALVEFRFEFGQVTQFGGAHRGEILGMGKQDGPAIADPLVKVEGAFGGVGGEIRCFVANADSHVRSPCSDGQGRRQGSECAFNGMDATQYRRGSATRRNGLNTSLAHQRNQLLTLGIGEHRAETGPDIFRHVARVAGAGNHAGHRRM